jgi:putative copper export protein
MSAHDQFTASAPAPASDKGTGAGGTGMASFPHAVQMLQVAAVLAGGSLAALGAAGHAASAPSWPRLAIAVDATHLLATGAWLGGLVPFVLFLQ